MKILTFSRAAALVVAAFVFVPSVSAEDTASAPAAPVVVASTTWTAAIADLAGIDGVAVVAPASMLHPSEYEVTVEDILRIRSARLFVYAGFERMMRTLGESAGAARVQKVECRNSLAVLRKGAETLAALSGTGSECAARLDAFEKAVRAEAERLETLGWKGRKVCCHVMQVPLAEEMGLEVVATFGPAPVTAAQIARAKTGEFDLIVDNAHNPVAKPLREVTPETPAVVWRNFPDRTGRGALLGVIRANASALAETGPPRP